MPLVSVIVPVRNGEKHLGEALTDIAQQSLTDLEIVVVDDGSTDSTPEILRDFAAHDPRVLVLAGPATGSAGSARNIGLAIAKGDYLSFLDADDRFDPELVERLYRKASEERADVAVTRFRVFDERTGERTAVNWGLRREYLPERTPFAPEAVGGALFYALGPVAWNKLFRAGFIRQHGLTFQPLRRTNDLLFTFSALARAERLTYVDRPLIDYRVGNAGSLQTSVHETPLDFAEALAAFQERLRDWGSDKKFEAAFVNEAAEVCLANLGKATTFPAFQAVYRPLRDELLEQFGLLGRAPGYFVSANLGERLSRLVNSSAEEYLFEQLTRTSGELGRARTETRAALREADRQAAAALASWTPAREPSAQLDPSPDGKPEPGRPDVSVIVPVYNSAPWLNECLSGIQRQTGLTLEVICIDDGSTDSSPLLLKQAAEADTRIRVIRQDNAGLSVARNRGVADATGRFLCFLDSDDYWGPDALAGLVDSADQAKADVILFDAVTVAEPGVDDKTVATYHPGYYRRPEGYEDVVTGPDLMARMKVGGDYRVQACLYLLRNDFVRREGLAFRPGLPREDNLFTFAMLLRAGRATHRPVPLYTRRLRPGSLITAGSRAAAARGYYVSFYEMLRLTAGTTFEDRIGRQVGATAFKAFKQARLHFVRLDPELGDRLADIDPQPDAQALFLILKQARDEAQRARRTTQRSAEPPAQPPARLTPLRRARRLAGRGYRYLRRILRRA